VSGTGFLNHGWLTLNWGHWRSAGLLRVVFGCTLDLRLSVRSGKHACRGFLKCGFCDINLNGVHLIDNTRSVCLKHWQWRLLFFHMVAVGILLLLLLNWLDCVDWTHRLGEGLVDDVGRLLFFEQSWLNWLFFVETYGLRFLTVVRGLYWVEQPLSRIECLIHSFRSSWYNSHFIIFLILYPCSSPFGRDVSFLSATLLRLMRVEWLVLSWPPPRLIPVRVGGTHRHIALIHVWRYWCATWLDNAAI
jgi:hypothetical protein